MTELLGPMERRFQYHFFTEQKTNDPSKPEWFFTQILNWITANIDLITAILLQIFKDKVNFDFFWSAKENNSFRYLERVED